MRPLKNFLCAVLYGRTPGLLRGKRTQAGPNRGCVEQPTGQEGNWTQFTRTGFPTQLEGGQACLERRAENERILLANLLQRSRTAFSCVSFSCFFAFKEGMYDTQISAVLSSPTVSGRLLYSFLEPPRGMIGASRPRDQLLGQP